MNSIKHKNRRAISAIFKTSLPYTYACTAGVTFKRFLAHRFYALPVCSGFFYWCLSDMLLEYILYIRIDLYDVTHYDHVFYDACCFCGLQYVNNSNNIIIIITAFLS